MQVIQSRTLKDTSLSWGKFIIAVATVAAITTGFIATAGATTVNGCDFDDSVAGTWSLQGDCTTTGPINVPANTTVEGNGYTITGGYVFGSNGAGTNTVIGIVGSDNVTINDLTVDGVNGTNLHGINVYDSTGVVLNDVTTKNNDKSGLVVNSSEVTVNNLTTADNGAVWHGVNVDQRAAAPASLTINGVSSHNEFLQVYVDDTRKDVSIIDTNNQYNVTDPQIPGRDFDANYVLKPVLSTKEDCKNGGYTAFGFKNQGHCVSAVVANEKASFKRN